jgi:tetratricopeptide (TPR) repeat protein
MSLFNFDKLNRPSAKKAPVDPIELFRTAPALSATPNDLWQGQSKALELWHQQREKKDVLISLHTGAGKTIVGLLAAQSLVNEGLARVLYICATNDLVIQTSREIESKLGFAHTTRKGGDFSNNLYSTGQGFCLTNYQALFNSRSVFRKDLRPEAIIFDDAHVAEKIIRDSYTIRITKEDHLGAYTRIVELLRPHFEAIHRIDYFDRVIAGTSSYSVVAAPPNAVVALGRDRSLFGAIKEAEQVDGTIGFAFGHLADHLDKCALFISQHAIEICPPFLPSKRVLFLSEPDIRRIYLSATLTSEVDFCRAFGRRPSEKIEPVSDAGIGERLIVPADPNSLKDRGTRGARPEAIAHLVSTKQKLLISTPTYGSARKYKDLALPPRNDEFSAKLDQFRQRTTPDIFVLVGRVDGIDLPHATCRVMLADGLPMGFSLSEYYLYDFLDMRNSFAAKLANRITQMFGRTNRGRNDYSVIFIAEHRFVNWLSTPRNIALLPELLRKQILLGRSLVEQFKIEDIQTFPQLIQQVIGRDPGWLKYYQDSIGGLDVSEDQRQQAAENDALLTKAALAEAEFAAQMWDGNASQARAALGDVVDKVVVADRRLAGWYNIQLGHTYEAEGDHESAAKQYNQAKARIHHLLALPTPVTTASIAKNQKPKNLFHERLLELFENDVRIQNDHIAKFDRHIVPLFDSQASTNQHEEALRAFGELLGFDSSRPEQETDNACTLDVLWNVPATREAILFELKTGKKATPAINKGDVGQGFNHIEWITNNLKDAKQLGLIFVSPAQACTREASPSDQMWLSGLDVFRKLFDDTIQMLYALQRMNPLERYAEIDALTGRAEWQPQAIFARLKGVRLLDVQKSA